MRKHRLPTRILPALVWPLRKHRLSMSDHWPIRKRRLPVSEQREKTAGPCLTNELTQPVYHDLAGTCLTGNEKTPGTYQDLAGTCLTGNELPCLPGSCRHVSDRKWVLRPSSWPQHRCRPVAARLYPAGTADIFHDKPGNILLENSTRKGWFAVPRFLKNFRGGGWRLQSLL